MTTKPLKRFIANRNLRLIVCHVIAVIAGMYLGYRMCDPTLPALKPLDSLVFISEPRDYNVAGTNMFIWIVQADYAFSNESEAKDYVTYLRSRKPALRANTIEE